jgi:glycosyltransferase involved in cell wall biosynthesis
MLPIILVSSQSSGGTEKVASNLFNNLLAEFPDTIMVVCFGTTPEKNLQSNVIYLNSKSFLSTLIKIIKIYIKYRSLQPIFLSFSEYANSAVGLLKYLKIIKSPVILRSSTVLSKIKHPRQYIRKKINKLIYGVANKVVCQSESIKNDLFMNYSVTPENLETIYNPILHKKICNKVASALDKKADGSYIICVGNLRHEKGHARLLDLYVKSEIDYKLLIVGSGEEYDSIKNLVDFYKINHKVKLVGYVSNPIELISRAVAIVIPSYFEGYPNVAVEAAFCGTPIISFKDCEVMKEIVEDGINGFIIDYKDHISFEKSISSARKLDSNNYQSELLVRRHDSYQFMLNYIKLMKCCLK